MFVVGPKAPDSSKHYVDGFETNMFVSGPKVRSTLVRKSLCFLESI